MRAQAVDAQLLIMLITRHLAAKPSVFNTSLGTLPDVNEWKFLFDSSIVGLNVR